MSTIAQPDVAVTGGFNTHLGTHMAAASDGIGGLLRVRQFPATRDCYAQLLLWLARSTRVVRVGVEGTGS